MIDPGIIQAASEVAWGSELHTHAAAVCLLRGKQPDSLDPMAMSFGYALPNWQLVVAEFMVFHQAIP